MEDQNKVIGSFLQERGLAEDGLTKRQRQDLGHILKIVTEMKEIIASNTVSVKSVAERTQDERYGHSISLATFYNNGRLLYDFVEYLKPSAEPTALDELKECKKENAELKTINAALIRRDVKFEQMQAEIDALRRELKLARDFTEANAARAAQRRQEQQETFIPPTRKGHKS